MKYFLIFFFFFHPANRVSAHPGIGIVKDSKGNIYYTDLSRVWKIGIDGKRFAVVNGVHTHELHMDENDNLYGEHSWYNAESSNTWGHYTWCLRPGGKLDTIIKPTEGFLENYSFVRDAAGNMYWVQRFTMSKFKKKTVNGELITIAEGKFKNIRWMHATKNGIIYFVDLTDLYKLENGKFSLLSKNLHERTSVFEYGSLDHDTYGIWTDKAENIYVAIRGGQVVKKITADGKVSAFAYSSGGWQPDSGLFDEAGNLWLLESNAINKVRVRKISQKDLAIAPSAFPHYVRKSIPLIIMSVLLVSAVLLLLYLRKRFFHKKDRTRLQLV